jgi:hypothetical protein
MFLHLWLYLNPTLSNSRVTSNITSSAYPIESRTAINYSKINVKNCDYGNQNSSVTEIKTCF